MTTIIDRIVELALQIQQIAAPTFHEGERAEFVRKLFVEEGLKDVTMDETGNVYGRWTVDSGQLTVGSGKFTAGSRPLVVSAHLDTVFPFEMDLNIRRGG
ncbi:MAG: hypothetical protein MZV64_23510 [Ignavibacteriales bacterium]|nr:hypothetical protein [Ignavibacteriales bacterium]